MVRYIIVCSLSSWILTLQAVASPELSFEQAIDSLDAAIQSLKSWNLNVHCSREFFIKEDGSVDTSSGKKELVITNKRKLAPGEKGVVFRESYRQVFQAGKGRIDFLKKPNGKENIGGQPNVLVYDGEMQKTYDDRAKAAIIGMPAQNIVPGEGWDYLHAYRIIQGRWPIINCLRQRKNVFCKEPDTNLVLLESAPCPKERVDYSGFGFRVILDKHHGFMPYVIERTQEIQGKIFTLRQTKVVEWKALEGGVWAPIKVVTRYFDEDPKWPTFGALHSEEVLIVDVARSSWNRDIPEETFNLPLPAGTKVIDRLRGVQYVTGQADPGKNLEDLAAHAKRMVPIPIARPPLSPQPWWQKGWVLGVSAGATLGLTLLLFFRYHRRRTGGVA